MFEARLSQTDRISSGPLTRIREYLRVVVVGLAISRLLLRRAVRL